MQNTGDLGAFRPPFLDTCTALDRSANVVSANCILIIIIVVVISVAHVIL